MAKEAAKPKDKNKTAKAAPKAVKAKDAESFKYGIKDLATVMGLKEASVRVKLRTAEVKKNGGKAYGWNTKTELDEVASKLKSSDAPKKAEVKKKAA